MARDCLAGDLPSTEVVEVERWGDLPIGSTRAEFFAGGFCRHKGSPRTHETDGFTWGFRV